MGFNFENVVSGGGEGGEWSDVELLFRQGAINSRIIGVFWIRSAECEPQLIIIILQINRRKDPQNRRRRREELVSIL